MKWGYCGPKLITDLFLTYCYGIADVNLPLKSCRDIKVLASKAMQPIHWRQIKELFEPRSKDYDNQFKEVSLLFQHLSHHF